MTTTQIEAMLTKGGTSVHILLGENNPVKHSVDKLLVPQVVPKQIPPKVWLIDLGRMQQTITISGYLLDEEGDTMYQKKANLLTILSSSGAISLNWDTNQPTYTGNIMKCDITEAVYTLGSDRNYGNDDTKAFLVTLQFIVGDFKG